MTDLAAPPQAPVLDIQRLVLVVTGSAAAAGMPFWVSWLRTQYPELQVTTVVTRSAQRFVTRAALAGRTHGEVLIDEWPPDEHRARHVELAEWAEAFVVYPATLHFIARLALGLADSPSLLAAQCSPVPIVIAPALPPGGMFSAAFRSHWSALATRENIVLVAPQTGVSLTTGRPEAWAPPPLPEVLEHLAEHRLRLATPVVRTVPS
ncbi:flavoprotein [Actinoplanes philippinensis]|uniref:flavoprotein n=1 Tax=Actinoplanes philippinensis TaxID=35752 RepID=UPI0033F7CE3F